MLKSFVILCALFVIACSPPPVEVETVIPVRDEILYDRDSGDCWVIKRADTGLVTETLFHSQDVDDCYQFTIKD